MKDYFTEEIGEIRKFVVEDPTYSELSDEKLRERISNMLERRMHQCELDDEEKASYYSSISFKAKKVLRMQCLNQFVGWESLERLLVINRSLKS